MDTDIKEQLVKSVHNIKNKLKTIQNEEDASSLTYKKVFKSIIDPLQTLIKVNEKDIPTLNVSNIGNLGSSSIEYDTFKEAIMPDYNTGSEYYSGDDKSPVKSKNDTLMSIGKEDIMDIYDNINIPFGIRSENMKLMIGNSEVKISLSKSCSNTEKVYIISISNKHYELTPGLQELLIRNKPNLNLISERDKNVYKDILCITNAHKRDFNPNGQIKGDKGLKYRNIIKPLFSQTNEKECCSEISLNPKMGGYIPKYKQYKPNTDYVYWDDPNELVERLKLLIASQSAGNTNHDNEIISIIEELKEAGIIKD